MPNSAPAMVDAAMPLRRYQREWEGDKSRNKIMCKARRIGLTWDTTHEIADDAAFVPSTKWSIVSRTQDTAKEAMLDIANHFEVMQIVERRFAGYGAKLALDEVATGLFFDDVQVLRLEAHLPNRSVIRAMTSHPDALRGFGGNVLLDEFAFARDSVALWRGATASTILGHRLLVVSTPNYQQGKFYELCKKLDMAEGRPPAQRRNGIWSCHWVDVHAAVEQGFPVEVEYCRELAGDDDTFQQEYCCVFLADGECFIGFDLIQAAESVDATIERDLAACAGPLYLGMDIGRRKDRTVIWVAEMVGDVLVTRAVKTLVRAPFAEQEAALYELLPRVHRAALDSTGMGMQLGERARARFGAKVEPVEFSLASKERMAIDLKRRFEDRRLRIPESPQIRASINAVKRYTSTNGSLRFDAARTEQGHADEFWALALCASATSEERSSMAGAALISSGVTSGLMEVAF